MVLNFKYIIGTHIMFYEIDMVTEHIQSILNAAADIENKKNITVKLLFNISEFFEKIDLTLTTYDSLIDKYTALVNQLSEFGLNVDSTIYADSKCPLTMVEFRRDLNYYGCQHNDFIIWGESDCLLPKETFSVLERLKDYTDQQNIHRYITTFAVRKMWDDSWKVIEHVDMTDKPLHPRTLPDGTLNAESFASPYSINYTMSIDEMNAINAKVDNLDIRITKEPKFDGSGLVISSDLIKSGVNIPPGIFGLAAEDSAFMYNCMQIMGQSYVQFVIKNILKVHNRLHPKKRQYALGMDSTESTQRIKGDWYNKLRDMNKINLNILTGPDKQAKFLSYQDYLKS